MKGNPLAGYGAGIRKETLLGWVAWYGISEPQVTHEKLRDKFKELGLDKDALPAPIRPGDAFKRACRYAEQSKIAITGTDTYANVLIRNVAQTPEMIERHIVIEIVDAQGRKLDHQDAVALTFYKKRYTVTGHQDAADTEEDEEPTKPSISEHRFRAEAVAASEALNDPDAKIKTADSPTLDINILWTDKKAAGLITQAVDRFREEFASASVFIDSQTLRGVIRRQLDLMRSFLLRSGGSVYFVPKSEEKKAIALTVLHEWIGNGSGFHILPLIDTEKQREMIQAAFEDEVHEEAKQMIFKLREAINDKTPLTAKQFTELRERKEALQSRAKEYSDLIDHEFIKAGTELALLDDAMSEVFMGGLVKT